MTRRNADQLDLLAYRPSAPVLPEPTITPPGPGSYREVRIEWAAPAGVVMVATDEDELDRMVAQIMETAADAGIVSFLRWGAQERGLRRALDAVFRESAYDPSFGEVQSLTVSGLAFHYDDDLYREGGVYKPREKEIGYSRISVYASRGAGWTFETFHASIGIRGIRKGSKDWRPIT